MGFFDSLLGTQSSKNLSNATGVQNSNLQGTQTNNLAILQNTAGNAQGALTSGTQSALGSLLAGYGQGNQALTDYSGQAQNALTGGVGQAASTVQGSNALFAPYQSSGTAANGMLGNALGLNGADGSAAARSAFQASPGYQYSVDQATDAASRRAASLGMAASGNTLGAITRLGSNLADQQWGGYLDRLSGLSGQGLSAAGSMSGNNALAGNFQYGGTSTLASLLNQTGQGLASSDHSLGTGQATLQSGLGNSLASAQNNLGASEVANAWQGANSISSNALGAARAQDTAQNASNGIFSKLLMGVPGTSDNGAIGSLFSGARSGFKL